MRKILLSISLFFPFFFANAQTETLIDDFNYTVTDPFSLEQVVATLAYNNSTDWANTNKAHWIYGLGLAATTTTNTAGKAGFAVGEKTVSSTVYSRVSGLGPTGSVAKDEINSEIGFNITLKSNNIYKVKFDVSPIKKVTYDIISVELLDKSSKSKLSTLYTKQFSSSDYGKKTITFDIPTSFTPNDYILNFRHTVTAIDTNSQKPSADIQGGLILDKIILVNTEVLSISDFTLENSINLCPNPCSNSVSISVNNTIIKGIELYDFNGRVIRNVNSIEATSFLLDTSNYEAGMYFITINTKEGIFIKKLLKM